MTLQKLQDTLSRLPEVSILVVGDYFLDHYLVIDPAKDEPSLETGLTAYQVVGRRLAPGAAGTVTNNLRALGVGRVIALGVIGDDGMGLELRRSLQGTGVLVDEMIISRERVTPTYTKPMVVSADGEREINRLDVKNWTPTPAALEHEVRRRLHALAGEVDAVIALDQVTEANHGVVTAGIRQALQELGQARPELPIVIDSRAYTGEFRECIIKCNHHEAVRAARSLGGGESVEASALALAKQSRRPVFVTCGAEGQVVVHQGRAERVPGIHVEGPIDIVGAGDATMAGIVCGLCCGAAYTEAAFLGNLVASITIQQLGTTGTASPDQVLQRYREL